MESKSIEDSYESLCQGKVEPKQFADDIFRAIFGEEPEEGLKKLNLKITGRTKGPCFRVIPKDSSFIFCRTCSVEMSCYCESCFQKSNHQGHFYISKQSGGGLFCHCGDSTHICPEGFCSNHDDQDPGKTLDHLPKDQLLKIQTNLEKLMIKAVVILESIAEVKENWNNEQAKAPAYTIINFLCHLCTENVHIRLIVLELLIRSRKSSIIMRHECQDLDQLLFNKFVKECECSLLQVFCRYSFLIEDLTAATNMSQIFLYGIRLTENKYRFLETILKLGKLYLQVQDLESGSSIVLSRSCLRVYSFVEDNEASTRFILSSKYLDRFHERIRLIFDRHYDIIPREIKESTLGHSIAFIGIVSSSDSTRETLELLSKTKIFETIACICFNFSMHNELPSTKTDETNSVLMAYRLEVLAHFIEALKILVEKAEVGGLIQMQAFEKVMLQYLKKYFELKKEEEMNPSNILLQVYVILFVQNRISQNFDWKDINNIKDDKETAEMLPGLVSNLVRHLGFYSEVMNEFWERYSLDPAMMINYENFTGGIDIELAPLQLYISCLSDSSTDVFQLMVSHFSPSLKKEWLERPETVSKTDAKEYNLFVDFLVLVARLIVDVTSITKLTFDDKFLDKKCMENPLLLERVNLDVVYILQTFGTLQTEVIGSLIPPCCEYVAANICDDGKLAKSKLKTKYKDVCETFIFEKHKVLRGVVADHFAKNQEKTFDTIIGKPPSHKDVLALRLIGTLINSSLVGCVTQIILSLQQIEDKHEVIRCAVKLYYTFLDALADLAAVPNVDLSRIVPLLVNTDLTHSLSESLSYKPLMWLTPQLQRLLDKIREIAITLGITEVWSYIDKDRDSLTTLDCKANSSAQSSKRKKEDMQALFRARQEQLMKQPLPFEDEALNDECEVCGICREPFSNSSGEVGFTLREFPLNDVLHFEIRMREKLKGLLLTPYHQSVRKSQSFIISGCFHKFHVNCFKMYKADYDSHQTQVSMKWLCPCPACKRLIGALQQYSEPQIRKKETKVDSFQALQSIIWKEVDSKGSSNRKFFFMPKSFLPLVFKRVPDSSQEYLQRDDSFNKIYGQSFQSRFPHLKYSLMWQDGLDFSTFIKEKFKLYQGFGMAFDIKFSKLTNVLVELKIECLRILCSLSIKGCEESEVIDRLEQQWCLFSPSNNFGRYSLRPFDPIDYQDILANNLHELYTYFMVSVLSFQPDLDIPSVNSVLLSRLYGVFALQNFISHCRINNQPINQFEEFERFIDAHDNKKDIESRFIKYLRTAVVIQLIFGHSDSELEQTILRTDFVSEREELEFLSKVCGITPLHKVLQEMKPVLTSKLETHLSDTRNTSSKLMKMLLSREQWVCDFITLPESYIEFVKTYSGRPCTLCGTRVTNSLFLVCLICGQTFCANSCPTKTKTISNFAEHIGYQHGSCGVMVTVPRGSTFMMDLLHFYDSVSLYMDTFGRVPEDDVRFQLTLNVDISKYKLNHDNLKKVRDIYFRSLIPDSMPPQE